MTYEVIEHKAWVREGFSSIAAHQLAPAGFELKVTGYRIARDGKKIFVSYPAFKTREDAEAKIAQLKASA